MFAKLSVCFIGLYQRYLAVIFPISCRFYPSCSEYAKQAIAKYGFMLGIFKAIRRILNCRPFSGKSGYDPVI